MKIPVSSFIISLFFFVSCLKSATPEKATSATDTDTDTDTDTIIAKTGWQPMGCGMGGNTDP